jgi:hypothetical protein
MNTEGTGSYTCKECHNTEPFKIIPLKSTRKEQLGDRRNAGESSCNSGDGTGQMAQPLMFIDTEKSIKHNKRLFIVTQCNWFQPNCGVIIRRLKK